MIAYCLKHVTNGFFEIFSHIFAWSLLIQKIPFLKIEKSAEIYFLYIGCTSCNLIISTFYLSGQLIFMHSFIGSKSLNTIRKIIHLNNVLFSNFRSCMGHHSKKISLISVRKWFSSWLWICHFWFHYMVGKSLNITYVIYV